MKKKQPNSPMQLDSLAARQTTPDLFHHLLQTGLSKALTTPETPKFDACVSFINQIAAISFYGWPTANRLYVRNITEKVGMCTGYAFLTTGVMAVNK
ncbi:hypothetical protein CEXT_142071 [Caerostris extrusa]|uniref:Uncharacterized protein n=1 Tax=Caerostris extrusa TaxID=172846 RepID=A0AAV4XJX8_CAEEX|nr:hypothetical protein CEXT_142071 [Caerostris extrusa]